MLDISLQTKNFDDLRKGVPDGQTFQQPLTAFSAAADLVWWV